jgi:activator of HSP90 ATPase
MPKTLNQKIIFKNQQVSRLYSMYLDSKEHTRLTGNNKAKISAKEGAAFSIYDGYSFGKNLQLVKNKLIVQSWRASDWNKTDIDSTLILSFEQKGKDAVINMVHANVPNNQAASLKEGWNDFYWKPWRECLMLIG